MIHCSTECTKLFGFARFFSFRSDVCTVIQGSLYSDADRIVTDFDFPAWDAWEKEIKKQGIIGAEIKGKRGGGGMRQEGKPLSMARSWQASLEEDDKTRPKFFFFLLLLLLLS